MARLQILELPGDDTAKPFVLVVDESVPQRYVLGPGVAPFRDGWQELAEARQWARHGYEIGQRHCSWSDHGVAPDWLTDGWPPHFDNCEHLQRAAEYDEALTRVRNLPTQPELMDPTRERPDIWLNGYKSGVLAAHSAARPREEKTSKP